MRNSTCFGFVFIEAFCIKKQFGEYFQALQYQGEFCAGHADTTAASLSKGACKLISDEASPDIESQSNTRPVVDGSFTPKITLEKRMNQQECSSLNTMELALYEQNQQAPFSAICCHAVRP